MLGESPKTLLRQIKVCQRAQKLGLDYTLHYNPLNPIYNLKANT